MQNEFEKVISQFSSKINNLYLSETKVLKQKIKLQNAEIKRLELKCANYVKTMQELEEANEALKEQLQKKETLLESLNDSAGDIESDMLSEEVSFKSCEEETSSNEKDSSPTSQTREKRSYSESSSPSSIENKMKAYHQKIKGYRNRLHSLEADKKSLRNEKQQLELEVSGLKQQLEAVSITSSSSHYKGFYHSCGSLYDKDIAIVSIATNCIVFPVKAILQEICNLESCKYFSCKTCNILH